MATISLTARRMRSSSASIRSGTPVASISLAPSADTSLASRLTAYRSAARCTPVTVASRAAEAPSIPPATSAAPSPASLTNATLARRCSPSLKVTVRCLWIRWGTKEG